MRSKIGTKSRLAAHILALFLLILMLVYLTPRSTLTAVPRAQSHPAPRAETPPPVAPPASQPQPAAEAPARSDLLSELPVAQGIQPAHPRIGALGTVSKGTPLQPQQLPLRPPEAAAQPETIPAIPVEETPAPDQPTDTPPPAEQPHGESAEPQGEAVAESASPETESDIPSEQPASEPSAPDGQTPGAEAETKREPTETPPPAAADAEQPVAEPVPDESAAPETAPEQESPADAIIGTAGDEPLAEPDESGAEQPPAAQPDESGAEQPPAAQPDESGALVVAASETGEAQPAAAPLHNANLEVLGDDIYWLDSSKDFEQELDSIPDLGRLVLLTPLPGYRMPGLDHVKTEEIPADPADLTRDAAERFLHATAKGPVIVAPLPGARGAAFFKGVYLLYNRNLTPEEVIAELEPELEKAGTAREEITHRLLRLKDILAEDAATDEPAPEPEPAADAPTEPSAP